ncbi:hypothetical protein [Streptomyces boninensis]|uniref:hypothetical protein n=1 Tax=Streptomyces boninensis TaxID=2039455 RepID=UPI003B20F3F4
MRTSIGSYGRRTLVMATAIPVAVVLAAAGCSSGGGDDGDGGGGAAAKAVTQRDSDAGKVFGDAHGMTLYTADQESTSKIICTKGCLAFWKPVTLGAKAAAPAKFDTVDRPDAVTVPGKAGSTDGGTGDDDSGGYGY